MVPTSLTARIGIEPGKRPGQSCARGLRIIAMLSSTSTQSGQWLFMGGFTGRVIRIKGASACHRIGAVDLTVLIVYGPAFTSGRRRVRGERYTSQIAVCGSLVPDALQR